jgi:hypothetical protein
MLYHLPSIPARTALVALCDFVTTRAT